MKDTLSTLDLHEKPGQRIRTFRHVRHGMREGPVPADAFSAGPHHGYYSYTTEEPVKSPSWYESVIERVPPQTIELNIPHSAAERASRLETDSDKRKEQPVFSGVMRYFPDALAEVARLSKAGNDKHNPGEPLHWSRGKSTDHLDCIARHMVEAGTVDTDGFLHDVKVAWRALANLQVALEREKGLPISPGSRP